jgi:toxin-antitoxin system PIN domain toxin
MRRSLKSFLFPDVNVWVALTLETHVHNTVAARWLASLGQETRVCFCRITQLSLLRLLTTQAMMGSEVMSQAEAWQVYDRWLEDTRMVFLNEPAGLERAFRAHSRRRDPSAKGWTDSYLVAFASASGLTLVSFDQGLRAKTKDLLLLTN